MVPPDGETERVLAETADTIRSCTRCRLHTTRTRAVPGEGATRATLMVIGEAPGRDEDASGRPFVGRAGRILDAALKAAGIRRDSAFITNLVKCRPPGNRRPKRDEWEACRPYLLIQIACVKPRVIVTLGATALRGLMGPGHQLKEARRQPVYLGEIPVLATYHPAAVLYNRKLEAVLRKDLRQAARRRVRPTRPDRRSTGGKTSRGRAARR